jgi:hypothetical protein
MKTWRVGLLIVTGAQGGQLGTFTFRPFHPVWPRASEL